MVFVSTVAPAEDAACAYKSLSVIERCFRTLKRTQLKLSPVYHRLPRCIEAHVTLCMMALLIERVVERVCEQSWAQLRHVLRQLQATKLHTSSHVFFQRNQPTKALVKLLKNSIFRYRPRFSASTPFRSPPKIPRYTPISTQLCRSAFTSVCVPSHPKPKYGLFGISWLVNSAFNALNRPLRTSFIIVLHLFVFVLPLAYLGSKLYGF